ncbi:hypothetical protein LTR37_016297 [Vermiconidia calcicola]|uniref:Uncharacterized protein n=1 Tax=Vermiconidia calcicola TaxID=1690605 RepID=A0ACC3MNG2_9PEZI|nr:hypothetical protein LTR37_016297 [Vermiconidia calcicola]
MQHPNFPSIARSLNINRSLVLNLSLTKSRITESDYYRDLRLGTDDEPLEEVQAIDRFIDEMKIAIDSDVTRLDIETAARNMILAEAAVRETRSGTTLTVLAVIFAPVSLAASVFGMNVQEVNATGHGIWIFLVCVFVSLALAFLAWAFCKIFIRARMNRRLLRRYREQQSHRPLSSRYDESDPLAALEECGNMRDKQNALPCHWRHLWAYHLGLASVDDLGIKERDLATDNMW